MVDSIRDSSKIHLSKSDGKCYRWKCSLPKVVSAGSTPESTGGVDYEVRKIGKDTLLRSDITNSDGARIVGLSQGGSVQDALTYLTPEMFGATGDGKTDDTKSIKSALSAASSGRYKGILLGAQYLVSDSISITDNIAMIGISASSGFLSLDVPYSTRDIICVLGKNVRLLNFSINFNTGGKGNIRNIKARAIVLESTTEKAVIENISIFGKYSDNILGMSVGIYVQGKDHTICNNSIEYCGVGILASGDNQVIDSNYCSNHYTEKTPGQWVQRKSSAWDGILCEKLTNTRITRNICIFNGQSGIYMGGNNDSLSHSNLIAENTVKFNWNRGIDTGVSGVATASNDVYNIRIIGNHCEDNREPDIWLYGTHDSIVTANICKKTPAYESIFTNWPGHSRQAMAIGPNAINNMISNNIILTTNNDQYAFTLVGTGNIFKSNRVRGKPPYWGSTISSLFLKNIVSDHHMIFTPKLTLGQGITLNSGAGVIEINGSKIEVIIDLDITASSGKGSISIGYVPGISPSVSKLIQVSLIDVVYAYNLSPKIGHGKIVAVVEPSNVDQIVIARVDNGTIYYDVAAYIGVSSKIKLRAFYFIKSQVDGYTN
ncbi:right-handed parallel beta-helix repeat-containing protein [Brenneria tiliae]|uniref:Right-handed parallel beta-helix repeat-containing protein n=1 Tax=Brenneria tiliae TaxID=2914984 RepID=A0ABT0MXR2_9GAMM|nr:right-handed parallel beta-helix repeat-containing protein [Brenneria tiliae]MCL2894641.1 right-handed parallel beta-helix repeat-containing protein [Brenneria tiliae]